MKTEIAAFKVIDKGFSPKVRTEVVLYEKTAGTESAGAGAIQTPHIFGVSWYQFNATQGRRFSEESKARDFYSSLFTEAL